MSDYEVQKHRLAERLVIAVETLAGIRTPTTAAATAAANREPEVWKEDQATDKQKAFMVSKSIPFQEPISKGEASEKIDRYINVQQKAR